MSARTSSSAVVAEGVDLDVSRHHGGDLFRDCGVAARTRPRPPVVTTTSAGVSARRRTTRTARTYGPACGTWASAGSEPSCVPVRRWSRYRWFSCRWPDRSSTPGPTSA
ncbi:hypothetical protein MTO96_045203 [Rhipicephalus appendiculatus]